MIGFVRAQEAKRRASERAIERARGPVFPRIGPSGVSSARKISLVSSHCSFARRRRETSSKETTVTSRSLPPVKVSFFTLKPPRGYFIASSTLSERDKDRDAGGTQGEAAEVSLSLFLSLQCRMLGSLYFFDTLSRPRARLNRAVHPFNL